jgi:asparagine N-glycosylation enzyme membrane subunit Stt3
VEKSTGGFRLVLDLKFINNFFEFEKVRFENLAQLRYAPTQVNYAISLDISDAYHHLRLREYLVKYFQFKINGEFFEAVGLPFGWAPAPGIFTKFVR